MKIRKKNTFKSKNKVIFKLRLIKFKKEDSQNPIYKIVSLFTSFWPKRINETLELIDLKFICPRIYLQDVCEDRTDTSTSYLNVKHYNQEK